MVCTSVQYSHTVCTRLANASTCCKHRWKYRRARGKREKDARRTWPCLGLARKGRREKVAPLLYVLRTVLTYTLSGGTDSPSCPSCPVLSLLSSLALIPRPSLLPHPCLPRDPNHFFTVHCDIGPRLPIGRQMSPFQTPCISSCVMSWEARVPVQIAAGGSSCLRMHMNVFDQMMIGVTLRV